MLGIEILLAHLLGDYILQSHWMAIEKTKRWLPAILHGVTYTIPYVLVTQAIPALLIICLTHIVIDRYRLARYVVWLKNQMAPWSFVYKTNSDDPMFGEKEWSRRYDSLDRQATRPIHKNMSVAPPWAKRIRIDNARWQYSHVTGYPANVPDYLAVWLMIIADNTIHLSINVLAILLFGM